jgi:diaminopimelate decarboxylase
MNTPRLTPLMAPWIPEFLSHRDKLNHLLREKGSPLHCFHTDPFFDHVREFTSCLDTFGIRHQLLFARKANKCPEFVSAALQAGIGVDTASPREVEECLERGVPPENVVITAAVKPKELLELAVTHGIPVVLDNRDEVEAISHLMQGRHGTTPVALRVSGFLHQSQKLYSRFGFDVDHLVQVAAELSPELKLEGLHFHLNGYSIPQRSSALHQCLDLAIELQQLGIDLSYIDMGGGILMNYLENESEWIQFQQQLKDAVMGKRPPLTFENTGLGLENRNGQLKGSLQGYPYYNQTPRSIFLEQVLSRINDDQHSVAQRIREADLELRLEPGRCLLDQCGITVARVCTRKQDSRGDWLISLEMNFTQMRSSNPDILVDPFVLYQHPPAHTHQEVDVFFTGAYCLESDLILKHRVALPGLPDVGDLVVFVNTAGYFCHFYESEAHLFPLAENTFI